MTYDADGLRSTKTVGTRKFEYQYVGDKLFYEKRGDNQEFYYFYDSYGNLSMIYYTLVGSNGVTSRAVYHAVTNAQGDVIALHKQNGQLVARYEYDAWGNTLSVTDANGNPITTWYNIANSNPIRYRGYYYDSDIGLYYLQSRYYDAEIGRFINADGYITTGHGVMSYNMYSYCQNNPVMYSDPSGNFGLIAFLGIVVAVACVVGLSGCSNKNAPAINNEATTNKTPAKQLTADEKVLIATIAAECSVTENGKPASSQARQAMANVALNRVGSREWSEHKTVAEVCQYTGFDGFGDENYQACMAYLNERDGSNSTYEAIIYDVMTAYEVDITNGCQLYYTPAAMSPPGSEPDWNFDILSEVTINGVDPYYEGRFYRYN